VRHAHGCGIRLSLPHVRARSASDRSSQGTPGRWTSLHLGDRLTAAIQVLRTRMAQTGLTASWTTIRNVLRTLPRITTAFARPASTPGPPGAYPQHGPPECRSGRDLPRDADRTPGPEPA
ncbi:MAG: hypothetical protein OXC68_06545, partial [Aestuariivita sp.]|nr:hypothetical protein [Aestuariivita sp.]